MKGLRVTSSGMPYSHIQISTGKPFTATYFKCTSDRYSQIVSNKTDPQNSPNEFASISNESN